MKNSCQYQIEKAVRQSIHHLTLRQVTWSIALMATVALPIICAGCSRNESEELSRNTKQLILGSDSVVVTTLRRNDDDTQEDETFRVTEEVFREQLASAIEFGDICPGSGAFSAGEITRLEFCESGIRTLVLTLVGPPDGLSGGRQTVLVDDYVNQKKVAIYSTENLYQIVKRKVRQMEAERESQER